MIVRWGMRMAFRKADRFRDQKRWSEAAQAYRNGLDRFPSAPGLWVQYGHMLKELGRRTEAEEAYLKALSLNPDDADIHLQMGHLYGLMEDPQKAEACYRRAAHLGSSDPHIAHFVATPRESYEDAPFSAEALFFQGDNHRDKGRWREAAGFYEQGLAKSSDSFPYLVQLGNVLKEAGDLETARQAYERALAIDGLDADLHLQIGHLQKRAGKRQQAVESYEKAVALGSRDRFALDALSRGGRTGAVIRRALAEFLPDHHREEFRKGDPATSFAGLVLEASSFREDDPSQSKREDER